MEKTSIHRSKHVPLLARLDKHLSWDTDDDAAKGGDYFKTKSGLVRDSLCAGQFVRPGDGIGLLLALA